jgi:hypothetical protein
VRGRHELSSPANRYEVEDGAPWAKTLVSSTTVAASQVSRLSGVREAASSSHSHWSNVDSRIQISVFVYATRTSV